MKRRKLVIRLSFIAAIVMVAALYMLLYFFPTVKTINRSRREAKHLSLKLEDDRLDRINFSFPDEREEKIFSKTKGELKRRLPKVRGRNDFSKLVTAVSAQLLKLAAEEGILDLAIEADAKHRVGGKPGGLRSRYLFLHFSGALPVGLSFINHIPWGDHFLAVDEIVLTEGKVSPVYQVTVKIYYAAGKEPVEAFDVEIDPDSEILLDNVYRYAPAKPQKRELPTPFGKEIFQKQKE